MMNTSPCRRLLQTAALAIAVHLTLLASASAQEPEFRLVLDREFGGMEDAELQVTSIPLMAVSAHGQLAVPLRTSRQVALIDVDSGELRVVGREGRGPGEIARLSNVGFAGDTLWVVDPSLGRVTHFPPDGSAPELTSAQGVIERGEGFLIPLPLTDELILSSRRMVSSADGGAQEIHGRELFNMTGDWEVRTRLVELRPELERLRLVHESVRSVQLGPHPFSVHPLFAYAPGVGSIVVARRADDPGRPIPAADVTRIGPAGDTIFHVALPPALPEHRGPIEGETIDAIVEYWVSIPQLLERFPSAAVIRSGIEEGLDPPARHPPATQLVLGIDGRTWVRGPDPWTGSVVWQVLDEEGVVVARARADRAIEGLAADEHGLWGVVLEELDVPRIARFRLEPIP
ncbi:MAG: hypothetical protein EA351_15030 [Gemmatimonadales bacterium]|nr:MAG: hypothetical protein EA351_15030 [Gemmatimonadales bacterium]